MAATENVLQPLSSRKSPLNRTGVLTIHGFGVRVRMQSGHLEIEDGIGPERRKIRLARVGHGLRRLVMIGSDGFITFEALRWLVDQSAAFTMLDRRGKVLVVTGPVYPSDAKLRRAQSLAFGNGTALRVSKELIRQKLEGQAALVRDMLHNCTVSTAIERFRGQLSYAESIDSVRIVEAQAAKLYWQAWSDLPIRWPRKDETRTPEHWKLFGSRISPLTHSPRLAANPPNAILNYLYAILEADARLAVAALGLDPGLGFLHFDNRTRDSLACDLMEPVRPQVDAYLVDWITREPFCREWFFEQRDGNCRLMGGFAARLAETAPTWSRAVAPLAEWVARVLWGTLSKPRSRRAPATRLTQDHRRAAKGGAPTANPYFRPRPPTVCRMCGIGIRFGRSYCPTCNLTVAREGMIEAARLGRVKGHGPEARARQAEKQRGHAAEVKSWNPFDKPNWLTLEVYREKIQPRLSNITIAMIASHLRISEPYAAEIRAGRCLPHPRHWLGLAQLVDLSSI
jgi:CRISPR-associated endonuclease Cas1